MITPTLGSKCPVPVLSRSTSHSTQCLTDSPLTEQTINLCESEDNVSINSLTNDSISGRSCNFNEPVSLNQFSLRSMWLHYMLEPLKNKGSSGFSREGTPGNTFVDLTPNNSTQPLSSIASPSIVNVIETFSPRSSRDICGNKKQIRQFKKWLTEWIKIDEERKKRQQIKEAKRKSAELNGKPIPASKKRQRSTESKAPRMKFVKSTPRAADEEASWDEEEDYVPEEFSDDDNDDNVFAKVFIFQGPSGCGKSSSVLACANELGFDVKEENTSESRSGSSVKKRVLETCQSKGMASGSAFGSVANSFFGGSTTQAVDETGNRCGSSPLPTYSHGMKLILFDEVDLIFEDETGLYRAIYDLAKDSKCPIVLTTQSDLVRGEKNGNMN